MMKRAISTRTETKRTGQFIRDTPGSQSLSRGLRILRAFRVGKPLLTNAEIAERTRLPRPTVSRLTRSLVEAGFLSYRTSFKAYQLEPIVLSLALVFESHSYKLKRARPLMDVTARNDQINVGLAVRDQDEMVYLDSLRFSRFVRRRKLTPGSRVPIVSTALGRAYLAGMEEADRNQLLSSLAKHHGRSWSQMNKEINEAVDHVARRGWCAVVWPPAAISIAAPVIAEDGLLLSMNVSFSWQTGDSTKILDRHAETLIELTRRVRHTWQGEKELTAS